METKNVNKRIYIIAIFIIPFIMLMMYLPRLENWHKINKLKLEKEEIISEKVLLSWELDNIKNKRNYYCWEQSVLKASWDNIRLEIAKLDNSISDIDNKLIKLLDIKMPAIETWYDLTWIIYDSSWIWRVNKDWKRHKLYNLEWATVNQRMKSLLQIFWIWNTYESWIKYWNERQIKPEVAVCIAFADTSLWSQTKTANNIWNVWNTDSWKVKYFNSIDWGIGAIFQTLNNKYFKGYNTIWILSQWGRTVTQDKWCWEKGEFCYATSQDNRNNNVLNCIQLLYWHENTEINETFNFRK
jgi:hypothetical protein